MTDNSYFDEGDTSQPDDQEAAQPGAEAPEPEQAEEQEQRRPGDATVALKAERAASPDRTAPDRRPDQPRG